MDNFPQLRLKPSLLFQYNLGNSTTDDFYQWMVISILSCTTALFFLSIIIVAYVLHKNRITGTLMSQEIADQPTEQLTETTEPFETKC